MEKTVQIYTEFVTLGQFLKIIDKINSGGEAKVFLQEYPVLVDGERETRRGRKLYAGMCVTLDSVVYHVEKK